MIVITSKAYSGDDLITDVEYDDFFGATKTLQITADIEVVAGMSQEQIKDYIRGRVATKRGDDLHAIVDSLVDPLIGIDIEGAP